MPTEDQNFADFVLNSIFNDLKKAGDYASDYSGEVLDSFDRQFNQVAEQLREAIHGASWIPDQVKAHTAPPPPRPSASVLPIGYLDQAQSWINRNRAWAAAVAAFAGTTVFLMWRSRRAYRLKRRARRAATGAKTEVIILSGSPFSPLTKSLALDLERRGFLIYIPVGSLEEESAVAELRVADINPLNFDITSTESTASMLSKFTSFLSNPQRAGTTSLHLASLILLPPYPPTYPVMPASSMPPHAWSDALNTHLLYPISLANTFLPLLSSQSAPAPGHPASSILLLHPTTIPSLQPADHSAESVTAAGLASYLQTLRSELPASVSVCQVHLGALDLNPPPPSSPPHRRGSPQQITLASRRSQSVSRDARELHNAVFDAAVGRRATASAYVGRGARTYTVVGKVMPRGLVAWMMRRGTVAERANRAGAGETTERGLVRRRRTSSNSSGGSYGSEGSGSDGGWKAGQSQSQEWERVDGTS